MLHKIAKTLLFSALPLFLLPLNAQAQIAADGTTSTTVTPTDAGVRIDEGDRSGGNLFHSFQDFSVPTGTEAHFNNANDVANIFSRVTGGNISDIDGLIRANGTANLFLINPNGIIFGENASLNIGGSFFATTADGILFDDGTAFSASDRTTPLLTSSIPVGANFRDNPGDIVNRSFALNSTVEFAGLEVSSGRTLALIGGDINFEGGRATASGGNIYLGGLADAGIVDLNEDGSLSFPEDVTLANITLTNAAVVDVTGTGGGNITIDAQNLSLAAGEFNSSFSLISGGIRPESTNSEAQAGNITINVAENIRLNNSFIRNQIDPEAIGNSGDITINTGSLELIDGSYIQAATFGIGNVGAVNVTARDINIDGESTNSSASGIYSQVGTGAEGDLGGMNISTTNLSLTSGGRIQAGILGRGNTGAVDVTARDINIDGESTNGFASGIYSQVDIDGEGISEGIIISTTNLNLTGGGQIQADTFGIGNAGTVDVTATGDITIDGGASISLNSGGSNDENNDGQDVIVAANNLNLTDRGEISSSVSFDGVVTGRNIEGAISGDINITVSENIAIDKASISHIGGGNVIITAKNLNFTNGGEIRFSPFAGAATDGDINITVSEDINFDGNEPVIFIFYSGITNSGKGDVIISANNLNLTNGGSITSLFISEAGIGGDINITVSENITVDGGAFFETAEGNSGSLESNIANQGGGNINISANNLNLTDGGGITAFDLREGVLGGDINITVLGDIIIGGRENLTRVDSSSISVSEGDLNVFANNLNLTNGGAIFSFTDRTTVSSDISITALDSITIGGETSDSFASGIYNSDGGNVIIDTSNLNIANGGQILAQTRSETDAGDIIIETDNTLNLQGLGSGIFSSTGDTGDAGTVNISASEVEVRDNAQIGVNNFVEFELIRSDSGFIRVFNPVEGSGNAGTLKIVSDSVELNIGSLTAISAGGDGGDINLASDEKNP